MSIRNPYCLSTLNNAAHEPTKILLLPSGEKGQVDINLTSRTWLISVMAKMVLSLQRMENAPEKGWSVEEGRVVKS